MYSIDCRLIHYNLFIRCPMHRCGVVMMLSAVQTWIPGLKFVVKCQPGLNTGCIFCIQHKIQI